MTTALLWIGSLIVVWVAGHMIGMARGRDEQRLEISHELDHYKWSTYDVPTFIRRGR